MKKILALLLVLALAFSFAACKGQPDVESSSDETVTTTSEETTVTTSEGAVTTTSTEAPTSSDTNPSSTSKPSSTSIPSMPQTSSSNPTTSTKPPVDTFNGTYADDTTVAALTYTYDSLKADLEAYVAANPSASGTVDLTSNFKKYSVLGYYVDGATMEAKVTLTADKKISKFTCKITAPYKENTFVEEALKRDVAKVKQFGGKDPMIYISMQYGNPVNYASLAEIPASRASKIYSGASNEFFNVKMEDGTADVVKFSIKTTRDAKYIKSFTSEFTVLYEY